MILEVADVNRSLRAGGPAWSVRVDGHVVVRVFAAVVLGAQLVVDREAATAARSSGTRTTHAFVRGLVHVVLADAVSIQPLESLAYDLAAMGFVAGEPPRLVDRASIVVLRPDGTAGAWGARVAGR